MVAERERAELHLLCLAVLFGAGGSDPLPRSESRERIDAARWLRLQAAAEALTAVGALSDFEVAPFRRRLEEEVTRGRDQAPAPVDEALARRARALLEERLEGVAAHPEIPPVPAAFDIPPREDPRQEEAVTRFTHVHRACKACGALSAQELSEWRERLWEVDAGRTWSLERRRRQARCTLAELIAVVPGGATPDGRLRVTTAELYADGVVLRWHEHAASAQERPARDPLLGPEPGIRYVSLSDDLGTAYVHFHTSEAHADGGAVLWTARFATAVPAAATRLVAEIREEQVTLRLPWDRGRR